MILTGCSALELKRRAVEEERDRQGDIQKESVRRAGRLGRLDPEKTPEEAEMAGLGEGAPELGLEENDEGDEPDRFQAREDPVQSGQLRSIGEERDDVDEGEAEEAEEA